MYKRILLNLFNSHKGKVSDKWISNIQDYDNYFYDFRNLPINILEIGIQNGGSLEVWAKYFKKSKLIIGADINRDCANLKFKDSRINIITGDVNKQKTYNLIKKHADQFDIIIDDGSHTSFDIIKSFSIYFQLLSNNGIYVIEDLHCSYWESYQGGLYYPLSSLAFLKKLADIVNYQHWGNTQSKENLFREFNSNYQINIHENLLNKIHSITFSNSLCIIRKNKSSLGKRLISGKMETITFGQKTYHNSANFFLDQTHNKWANFPTPPEIEYEKLKNKLSKTEHELTLFKALVSQYESTLSWKITKPLRFLRNYKKHATKSKNLFFRLINYIYRKTYNLFSKSIFFRKIISIYKKYSYNTHCRNTLKEIYEQKQNIITYLKIAPVKPLITVVIELQQDLLKDSKILDLTLDSLKGQFYKNYKIIFLSHKKINNNFYYNGRQIENISSSNLYKNISDYFIFLTPGNILQPNTFYEYISILNTDPSTEIIYSDEDSIDLKGKRSSPFFKPVWSPDYLETFNYIGYNTIFIKKLLDKNTKFISYYDLVLRLTEKSKNIKNISKILSHKITNTHLDLIETTSASNKFALEQRLIRTGRKGFVFEHPKFRGCFFSKLNLASPPKVSIVIPTAGKLIKVDGRPVNLITNLVDQIRHKTDYKNIELIIVHNSDLSEYQLKNLKRLNCKLIAFEDKVFNISKKLNLGVASATGDLLLLMNDDIEIISPNWISKMIQHFQKPHAGVVGVKLIYPDRKIQHVGVVFNNGNPDHVRRFYNSNEDGYFYSSCGVKNYMAVTGAVMMTRRSIYNSLLGYEENLAVSFNDIDFCLKVKKMGYEVICASDIELYHMESASRKPFLDQTEYQFFSNKWSKELTYDPYYNENYLSVCPPNFELAINKRLI
jgi:hypothetical protein